MKLKSAQLGQHLQRYGLAPIYLLTGDEPLQLNECADTLRTFARQQGFSERIVLTVEVGFDWNNLIQYANNLSLFASKRLLEVHLNNKLPGNEGSQVLITYVNHLSPQNLLLIIAQKLDTNQQKTKWFTTVDNQGIIIPITTLEGSLLATWITQRLSQSSLQATVEAINIIAERCQGHLLAAAQEIEKLSLLYGASTIDTAQVLEVVADSARFELFAWIDTVLKGEVQQSIRQLAGLRGEGVEPVLITWILNREIRQLCQITYALRQDHLPQQQVFKTYQVWQSRQETVLKAISRYPQSRIWQQFLTKIVKIEQIVKGSAVGNPWDELQRLSLQIAGKNLFNLSP
ncbi:DNA polymerase III subunit delta [Thioploca ingrica]|uniref:DNA polymerase III subunit delta n=1 Tax=Thioploca ingrica TaxID=40754 RepID=A0A090BVS1_9GAMM|nr:DNA polymerase III subunit delta [Thioploca ingrica]